MSDRRKAIEEAASSHASIQRVGLVDPAKYYSFVEGAEWADANNAEIPPKLLPLLDEAWNLIQDWKDGRWPGHLAEAWIRKYDEVRGFKSAETPSPTTEGSEDRGT